MQATDEKTKAPIAPPSDSLTIGQWARRNLFNTIPNGIVTSILFPVGLYLSYRLFRFVFITGQWDAIDGNLELFMVGLYPRDEFNRISAQILLLAAALGLALGLMRSVAKSVAKETNEPFVPTPFKTYVRSFWALALFVFVLLAAFTHTAGPTMLVVGAVVICLVAWRIGSSITGDLRAVGWTVAAVLTTSSFQYLSGTGGWAWGFTTLALIPTLSLIASKMPVSLGLPLAALGALASVVTVALRLNMWGLIILAIGLYGLYGAVKGDKRDGGQIGMLMLAGVVVYFIMGLIDHSGINWEEWGGFHLNMVVTAGGIVLSFPLGIMLAMGRRSSLPMVKIMSVAYIEFFRGAPLITFLLAAQFFLGFFLNTTTPLSLVTRVMAAITLFSAAYIAEIIRGGLQAVPKGQIEAGQAMGMSQAKIMRLIVLPQALRAVIPAMVGQFISLFKDTTLLSIVSLPEFLQARTLAHAQAEFRGFGIAETLTFVAFGFWAIAYSMSQESQRLERRLGVGVR